MLALALAEDVHKYVLTDPTQTREGGLNRAVTAYVGRLALLRPADEHDDHLLAVLGEIESLALFPTDSMTVGSRQSL